MSQPRLLEGQLGWLIAALSVVVALFVLTTDLAWRLLKIPSKRLLLFATLGLGAACAGILLLFRS